MAPTKITRLMDFLHKGVVIFLAGNAFLGFSWLIGGGVINAIKYKLDPSKYNPSPPVPVPVPVIVDVDAALREADEKK